MGAYEAAYRRSLNDPAAFWDEAAAGIDWDQRWDQALDVSNPPHTRWFRGGRLNTCWNAVDRHVEAGHGDRIAIAYDSPVTKSKRNVSYRELQNDVARFAGAMRARGVAAADRVVIYMPMVPEAVIAALACARLGAVHSIVFGGFAANELAVRIDDCQAKLIIAASCGIEPTRVVPYKPLLDAAIDLATHKPERCIILQRKKEIAPLRLGRDETWDQAMADAEPVDCVSVAATDPLYILYTSGTTGKPKGVVRDNGGHAVALNWSLPNIYGVKSGETFWAASDVGWVVGHSYIIYAPLLNGCTTVLYEGKPVGTPDPGAFWRVIAEHGVCALFTAPTAIRAIRQQDPDGAEIKKYDLSRLRNIFLAGERCDPTTQDWLQTHIGVDVIDNWWQTETGWPIASNCIGLEKLPIKLGSPTRPAPGWDVQVLGADGRPLAPGQLGEICVKAPLPPSAFPTLWGADDRYRRTYFDPFPGYYKTGDAGMIDEDGYVFIMARTDDVINVAGHRLSTGQIEEVLAKHPAVAEAAVIGAAEPLKGQLPIGFVVLKAGATQTPAVVASECVERVRAEIGAVAAFKTVMVVPRLPKTRSGKILRGAMQKIADREKYPMPATIEDPSALKEIAAAVDDGWRPEGVDLRAQKATTFRGIKIDKTDADDYVAGVADIDEADLPNGDVTVDVAFSTINYKDGLAITGDGPVVRRFPMVAGIDFAGTVAASDSPDFKPGDRVVLNGWGVGETHWGGLGQKARVKADWLIKLPDGFSMDRSMAVGTAGYTAMLCVLALERHGLKPADGPVLVTGAVGGVGSVAIAILAKLGWHVIASTGRMSEADYLQSLGATEILDRAALGRPGKPLQRERWIGAVDSVGSHTLANVCAGTLPEGAVAACGLAQGMDLPASVAPFILRGVSLLGINSVTQPKAKREQAWRRLAKDLDMDLLDRMVTHRVDLDGAMALAPDILSGKIRGRTVVDVNGRSA